MNAKAGEHRRSEICGLDVTISPRYDWSVASFHYVIGISGILPYSRNVTLQTFLSSTRDFYRLHSTFARLYNAAASPASRLRSAGSLAIINLNSPYCIPHNLSNDSAYLRHFYIQNKCKIWIMTTIIIIQLSQT